MTTAVEEKKESQYFTFQDIQEAHKTGGGGLKFKPYDPKIFWDSMVEAWFNNFNHPSKFQVHVGFLIDRLKVIGCETLLEPGCGFARLLPFLLDAGAVKSVHGIDISAGMLKKAESYLEPVQKKRTEFQEIASFVEKSGQSDEDKKKVLEIAERLKTELDRAPLKEAPDFRDKIVLAEGDVRKLAFEDNSFDAVISGELLQYLSPTDAETACREMYRVARKAVILCERWAFPDEHSEPHIWSHNYAEIFKRALNVIPDQITSVGPGIQGVVILKS